MNYPYPIPGTQANPTAFTADNTRQLGSISQSAEAKSGINIDYSLLLPALTISAFVFRVSPGGEPQLKISQPFLTPTAPAGKSLAFVVDGGIPGRTYSVSIDIISSQGIRTDTLVVNIEGDDCGCAPVVRTPPPGFGGATSGDGDVFVNTAPRFFVSGTIPVGGIPFDRWYDTTNGDIYDCVTNGIVTYWILSIPAGGSVVTPTTTASVVKISPITLDGVTKTFNLFANTGVPVSIVGTETLFVSVDGVWQEASVEYIASANQITFVTAPAIDSKVFMLWFATPTDITDGADGANIVKINPITPDGVTTTFILNSSQTVEVAGSNALFVSLDGVWQESGVAYVAAASLISFLEAPAADAKIFMLWFAPPVVTP